MIIHFDDLHLFHCMYMYFDIHVLIYSYLHAYMQAVVPFGRLMVIGSSHIQCACSKWQDMGRHFKES